MRYQDLVKAISEDTYSADRKPGKDGKMHPAKRDVTQSRVKDERQKEVDADEKEKKEMEKNKKMDEELTPAQKAARLALIKKVAQDRQKKQAAMAKRDAASAIRRDKDLRKPKKDPADRDLVHKESYDEGEYDFEGDMAKNQLSRIIMHAKHFHDMLEDNTNLPEWVQSKITKAEDYISTAHDYMMGEMDSMNEKVDMKKADMGDVIKDFQDSDAPQFKGKSQEKRRQMAIAAKLDAEDKMKKEELSAKQKKIDKNRNGKIDGADLAKLRGEAKLDELSPATHKSYQAKAFKSGAAGMAAKRMGTMSAKDAYDNEKKRHTGIELSKSLQRRDDRKKRNAEEVELDERDAANALKRKTMDAARGARFKQQNPNMVPDRDKDHKTPQQHNKAIGRALRTMGEGGPGSGPSKKSDVPFDGPYKKASEPRKDRFGNIIKKANVARHLARAAAQRAAAQKPKTESVELISFSEFNKSVNKEN